MDAAVDLFEGTILLAALLVAVWVFGWLLVGVQVQRAETDELVERELGRRCPTCGERSPIANSNNKKD